MTAAATPARDIPAATPREGAAHCAAQLAALLAFLRTLDTGDWDQPTDCTEWTVRDVLAHVVGQFEGFAKPWVFVRRYRAGHRNHPGLRRLDALTRQQVDELRGYPPETLIDRLAVIAPKAVRAGLRMPGPIRALDIGRFFPEDPLPDRRLGYLTDVVGARATWMHRMDIAHATGRAPPPARHDGDVVALVIREVGLAWAGPAVILELTGPAGGRWLLGMGDDDPALARADAVEYLRGLSGRVTPRIDIDRSPAIAEALVRARAVF
jgi:uncharacterized protein (TIGR03083 family)